MSKIEKQLEKLEDKYKKVYKKYQSLQNKKPYNAQKIFECKQKLRSLEDLIVVMRKWLPNL